MAIKLPNEAIKEFQEICKSELNFEIPEHQAEKMAQDTLQFLQAILNK